MMAEKPIEYDRLPSVVANRVYFGNMDLEFMKKIKFRDTDDLLKQVSKIVSYILRHGADEGNKGIIPMDEDKQVEVVDLLEICRRCCGVSSYSELVRLLNASNENKRRYAFIEQEDGKLFIKAVHKYEVLPGTSTKIQPVKDTKWLPSNGNFRKGGHQGKPRMFQVLRSDHFEMVIVRKGMDLASEQMGCLQRLEIVELLGEPIIIADGIVRIKIKSIETEVTGWVTQDARKADGPQFLQEITETYWADAANSPQDEDENPESGEYNQYQSEDGYYNQKGSKKGSSRGKYKYSGDYYDQKGGSGKGGYRGGSSGKYADYYEGRDSGHRDRNYDKHYDRGYYKDKHYYEDRDYYKNSASKGGGKGNYRDHHDKNNNYYQNGESRHANGSSGRYKSSPSYSYASWEGGNDEEWWDEDGYEYKPWKKNKSWKNYNYDEGSYRPPNNSGGQGSGDGYHDSGHRSGRSWQNGKGKGDHGDENYEDSREGGAGAGEGGKEGQPEGNSSPKNKGRGNKAKKSEKGQEGSSGKSGKGSANDDVIDGDGSSSKGKKGKGKGKRHKGGGKQEY
ncbi:unnamed protein product [Amoebophrya sp. A120]|nr:unnamed protein product [Amoebophrya sp. A120]|eukprot:GSA120T00003056001.1